MEIMYRDKELENMGRIPCGYSLPNYDTYIVDEELRPVPVGCPGEICIGGAGVSLGYFKNAELTDKHFVSNPFATPEDITKGWTRMYRTGDIAHLRKDGAMVFHNRIEGDSQVKIRGLRIDLSDIESNIIMAAGGALKEAVVTLREGDLLVAHVIFAPNRGISDTTAFLEQLLSNLDVPQYMIPVAAIALDKFPLSNHSKVDRKAIKALPLPKRTQSSQQDVKLTEAMLKLRDIWREVLGQINKDLGLEIGPSTSFFQIGGNSLTLIKLQAKIRERLRIHVSLDQLFKKTTLAGMTNQLQGRQSKDSEVSSIDWTLETTLESDLAHTAKNDVSHEAPPRTPPEVIILTGATGFLGQELLKQLLDSKTIRRVYCLAIRKPRDNQPSLFHHSKVTLCHGDLSAPRLGLSVEEAQKIFGEADAVIHSGADVSFMKSYSTLHPTNVGSTKELVRLCLPRRLPFHFISTTAVARISGRLEFGLESVAPWPPSSNFRNNYVFTKWVCEVYLENVSRQFNLPMLVYRPSTITGEGTSEVDLMSNVLKYSKLTGTVPTSDTWKGSLDFIDVKEAARMIAKSLAKGMKREDQISYIHVSGGTQVPIDGLAEFMESVEKREFATVPFTEWIEDVAEVGMNPLLVTYLRGIGTRRATLVFPKLERGQVQGTLATLAPTRSSSSARMWKGAEAASGIAA
jgi:hybrid polyketide synthase/nonribosomal peptide synthetase ACE1